MEVCTKLLPAQLRPLKDTSIELFIQNILDKHNITYIKNDRTILGIKELDIYIPSKNIAIECNGLYWHSSLNKERQYHINKYKTCKSSGIQLISVWEDQIINKPNIIESIILSKLNIFNKRIYARDCVIKKITNNESNHFLDENHLQGKINANVCLGLYYNDDLVSVMTFGKKRKIMNHNNLENQYEMYRFCNKTNICVIGGASRLLKHFINNYEPSTIVSFASNDISNGKLYETLGFSKVDESISFWYIESHSLKRYHRYKFRSSELNKHNISEYDILHQLGYYKIYDTGQSKYEINIK
jgi:G:T-mismatch repair DNA endonuclease (very short patch repair protein)